MFLIEPWPKEKADKKELPKAEHTIESMKKSILKKKRINNINYKHEFLEKRSHKHVGSELDRLLQEQLIHKQVTGTNNIKKHNQRVLEKATPKIW